MSHTVTVKTMPKPTLIISDLQIWQLQSMVCGKPLFCGQALPSQIIYEHTGWAIKNGATLFFRNTAQICTIFLQKSKSFNS